jgi:kynureninase
MTTDRITIALSRAEAEWVWELCAHAGHLPLEVDARSVNLGVWRAIGEGLGALTRDRLARRRGMAGPP